VGLLASMMTERSQGSRTYGGMRTDVLLLSDIDKIGNVFRIALETERNQSGGACARAGGTVKEEGAKSRGDNGGADLAKACDSELTQARGLGREKVSIHAEGVVRLDLG
jgi:hypothetical protein